MRKFQLKIKQITHFCMIIKFGFGLIAIVRAVISLSWQLSIILCKR